MLTVELLPRPAHGLSPLFWGGAVPVRLRACHLGKHLTVAIAVDELHGNVEAQQTRECFTGHRARKHIAPDHDMVDFCLMNILEYSLKRGEVRMNIIECSDA